ncbi:HAD family hydrolase [Scatolibacter rhodanostii]|uniref:HAD family hydrolase n=1 Tax=Scatolibacter rhodanostii TaxID=2014781 RepID=UPI000C0867BD|nr:HAD family phosphatase [Scatolibacter rhodanostii]
MKNKFIFDFDGTLMDSMYVWDTVDYEFLEYVGVPKSEIPDNLPEVFKAKSLWEAAEYFIDTFHIAMRPELVCSKINDLIEEKYRFEIEPKPGVIAFLEKHKDKEMCIATATDQYLVEYALRRTGLGKYFSFIITSVEVGNSKREPDIFLQAAERLNAKIEDCIIFEDSPHALQTAKLAGFYTVAVKDESFLTEEETIRRNSNQYVSDLNEVIFS